MIGKTISHYKILEKLGEGGMGVVYKAQDTKLDRLVALKFLPAHLSSSDEEKRRFIHEAKAASGLQHNNICTIHEIDETKPAPGAPGDGQMFICMDYYEGQTLKERIERGPLNLGETIDIALQTAEGLAKAHEKEIVHRDLKPANVIITKDGVVKIVDFGLAKLRGMTKLTKTGTTLGTVSYMSPEQARGEEVDHRTDIFSFGVLLYEMVMGQQPFDSDYEQAIIYSILHEEPRPLSRDVPEELQNLVFRALEKDPEKRFQSADEIVQHLKKLPDQGTIFETKVADLKGFFQLLKRPRIALAALALLIILAAAVLVPYRRLMKVQHAGQLLPRIERLAQAGSYFEAYELALQAEEHLKNDSTLANWMPIISHWLTIITQPAGASVYLRRFAPDESGRFPAREYVGITPINHMRIARHDYKVYLEKEGFIPVERIVSNPLLPGAPYSDVLLKPEVKIDVQLIAPAKAPANMVFVPGGKYRLVSWGSPTAAEVSLDDYFIDKFEVSNKQYKEFIEAGGYLKREYWQRPFFKDGVEISFAEAMQLLVDRSGLPGPRTWLNQEFPQGTENHPVTDITWYEAAAYAEFAGKSLPTIFQWEKAARDGAWNPHGVVLPWGPLNPQETISHRANFEGESPVDVESYEFGISPYGCYNMAGNVKEWCLNEISSGYVTAGGSWEDPVYLVAHYGIYSSFYASSSLGFRCVSNSLNAKGDQGAMKLNLDERTPTYYPVDEETFKGFLSLYKYDRIPLDAQVLETVETPDWTRLKVSFTGVHEDLVLAYLFLPKQATKPFQCINFIPHSGVFYGFNTAETAEYILGPHIKSGRAVLAVVPKGAGEREWGSNYDRPGINTVKYREQTVNYATEFSLGLDYLATRDDIDMGNLAYVGVSWGAAGGLIFAAVEDRYRTVVFIGGGLRKSYEEILPEANPINFLSYIKQPKLLLNGKYDEDFPFETHARPFYNLMREPKELALLEGGHVPPLEQRVSVINNWLDETLEPVKFE